MLNCKVCNTHGTIFFSLALRNCSKLWLTTENDDEETSLDIIMTLYKVINDTNREDWSITVSQMPNQLSNCRIDKSLFKK